MIKNIFFSVLLLLNSGCSTNLGALQQNLNAPENSALRNCAEFYVKTEQAVVAAQVVDAQAARIDGYPYLRVNRFLSSYRNEVSGEAFENWISRLQELAIEGWQIELMNLPIQDRHRLDDLLGTTFPASPTLIDALHACGNIMRKNDLDQREKQDELRENATVPEEYQTWQRIVGFYPLTALAFRSGINRWHEQTLETYGIPLPKLPVKGHLPRYSPARNSYSLSAGEVADIIKQSSENPLAIPVPDPAGQKRLFDSFAPIFEIDVASGDDKIGVPVWKGNKTPVIDTLKPTVYRQLSHTRMGKQVLLQLNYLIWFPSRPKNAAYDLLSGHLDGIIWRVTLLPDGKPWIFDSIHACGCYHLFFPTRYTLISEQQSTLEEPAFMPQQPLNLNEGERTVIRIASTSHYIERVYFSSEQSDHETHYQWDDANSLRSLPMSGGNRRSLFGQDGIVAGSERSERFLFWPMGIPSPGAMRQWGHHATAFVGRRHFDDPRIFDNSFDIFYQKKEPAYKN
jgi:predicted DNA-binding antitoxin AbrB/MazE fold protein